MADRWNLVVIGAGPGGYEAAVEGARKGMRVALVENREPVSYTHMDYAWMKARQFGDVVFEDISDRVAQLALQGPKAMDVLKKVAKEEIPDKYYTCLLYTSRCV